MKRYAHLIFVDHLNNHNKYYEVFENDDNSLDVRYGRVGQAVNTHHYAPREKNFDSLILSKKAKGYTDDTLNYSEKMVTSSDGREKTYKKEEDSASDRVLNRLLESCRKSVQKNYSVKPCAVTGRMIYSAKELLKDLSTCITEGRPYWRFNETLEELFSVIPRRMASVSDYLSHTDNREELLKILDRETEILTALETTYSEELRKASLLKPESMDKTMSEAIGIKIRPATYKEEDEVKELMGDRYEACTEVFSVVNEKAQKAFEECKKAMNIPDIGCRLLFHGSGAENWLSILEKSLIVNADGLGLAKGCAKGLGNGVYFADDPSKSLNYTHGGSGDTYLGVFDVALGKMWDTNGVYIGHSTYNGWRFGFKDLKDGCQSVFLDGKKSHNSHHLNEHCVYKSEQITPKYLLVCGVERRKNVRFSMKLSVPFKDLREADGILCAKAELSAYAKKELGKISEDVRDITAEYDMNTSVFTLFGNGKKITLTEDEKERLSRDFKKSFFESEKAFTEYTEAYIKENGYER